jgi:transposase
MSPKSNVEKRVKDIRRNTRKKYSAEEKIRIILEGLRGEETIVSICRVGLQNIWHNLNKKLRETSSASESW